MPLATAIKPAKSAVQDKATMVCNYAKDKAKKAAAYVKMNAQELQKFFAHLKDPRVRMRLLMHEVMPPIPMMGILIAPLTTMAMAIVQQTATMVMTEPIKLPTVLASLCLSSYTYDVHCTKHSSRVDAIQNCHHLFEFCTPTNK